MKTAVDKVNKGKGRIVNARFAVMCAHYLFDAGLLQRRHRLGERRRREERAGQPPAHLDRGARAALRSVRRTQCVAGRAAAGRCGSEVRHPEHEQLSVAEMLEHEQRPSDADAGTVRWLRGTPARVSAPAWCASARNRYSVPCELAGQMVSTRLYPDRVVVVADDAVVAEHERLPTSGQMRYDWQHYIPLMQRKPGALRNGAPFADMPAPLQQTAAGVTARAGRRPGDGARYWRWCRERGLEAVLVAVELALEQAPPSGRVSVEHVRQRAARVLNACRCRRRSIRRYS